MREELPYLRIIVVGDPMDFLKGKLLSAFTGQTEADAFDNYTTEHVIGNHTVKLDLRDIINQEDDLLSRIRQTGYLGANAILLVFQFSSAESFKRIKEKWHPEIKHCVPHTPIILLGVKSDDPVQVTVSEVKAFTDEHALDAFIECRLDTPQSIKRAFDYAVIAGLAGEDNQERKLIAAECYKHLKIVIEAEPLPAKKRFIASAIEMAKAAREVNKQAGSQCFLATLPLELLKPLIGWVAVAEGYKGETKNTIDLICSNISTKTWKTQYNGMTLFSKSYPLRKAIHLEENSKRCIIS